MRNLFFIFLGLPVLISGFCKVTDSKQQDLIKIKKDSLYTITLSASFGEGYSWKLNSNSDTGCIELVKETTRNATDKDGGMDVQEFLVKGKKRGSATLQFIYVQPWLMEKSSKYKTQTYSFIVQ